jgi:hypothetical protein
MNSLEELPPSFPVEDFPEDARATLMVRALSSTLITSGVFSARSLAFNGLNTIASQTKRHARVNHRSVRVSNRPDPSHRATQTFAFAFITNVVV